MEATLGETFAATVESVLAARKVAVVGASSSGRGLTIVENFRSLGFTGEVACVNPKYQHILGYPCYPALEDVPFIPDAVVVAVSRERVIDVLEQAARKRARGAVVFAVGFGEADELGRDLETRLRDLAQDAEMAVVGPNCQGLINFCQSTPLYMDSVQPYQPGVVGLIAQSGSVLTALVNNRRGVRWGHVVSTGNETVVDAADVAGYYIDNPEIAVICAFLEVIRRPKEFFRQCDRAHAAGKPVIICKIGRTAAAQEAATAHSGALAEPDRLVDALLRRHGVIRAESLEELLETAIALQSKRRPRGQGMAAVSTSGAQIALLHDNLPGTGLALPEFAPDTRAALAQLVAPFVRPANPLDWWGTADPDGSLPPILETVAADPAVDIVIQVSDFTAGPTGVSMRARRPLRSSRSVLPSHEELFVVLDAIGGAPQAPDFELGVADEILVLSGLRSGLRALGHLVEYEQGRRALSTTPDLQSRLAAMGVSSLTWTPDVMALLRAAGFAVARSGLARTPREAVTLGNDLGYPVVAKIADERVAHKSEVGGVLLNLQSPGELSKAAGRLLDSGATRVLVQEQIVGDVELFLGLESSPELGTFILAGLGGIWAELVDDVQIRPAGLRKGEAEEMLRQLRGYRRLKGARGRPPIRLDVVAETIMRLDAIGLAAGERIESLDINPLIIREGEAIVADALLIPRSKTGDRSRPAP
jgi:acetate---CoA ligase (ADP-forming)